MEGFTEQSKVGGEIEDVETPTKARLAFGVYCNGKLSVVLLSRILADMRAMKNQVCQDPREEEVCWDVHELQIIETGLQQSKETPK